MNILLQKDIKNKNNAVIVVVICVCVCVCVWGNAYVVYEDTNLYNDMGMT